MSPFALFELKGRKTEHTPRRQDAEERQLQCCLQALSARLGAVGWAVSWEARATVLQRGSLRLSNESLGGIASSLPLCGGHLPLLHGALWNSLPFSPYLPSSKGDGHLRSQGRTVLLTYSKKSSAI